ncbi:MAG: PIG-L family deacetylase [Lachnospira sp.]|nr:PIG-L family deacetylase [Lachnospira sp.]
MIPIDISSKDKILIIAPHPDDECIGVGGILSKYADRCSVIVLTDGCQGQGNQSVEDCRIQRKNEFISEMEYLGINDYKFLEIIDGTLISHLDCMNDISLKKYSKIFVTGYSDGHVDHTAAYHCIVKALMIQNNIDTEVYLYEVHKELVNPTHYLNITDCIDRKLKAIRFHDSQLGGIPYDYFAEITAVHRGIQNRQPNSLWEVYQKIELKNQNLLGEGIEKEKELSKFKQFYQILTKWMLNDDSKEFYDILRNKYSISRCIIYGYAELGKILEKKLLKTSIQIDKIIDKKCLGLSNSGITINRPEDISEYDVPIIVTATYYYDDIKKELQDIGHKYIYSLFEIVTNL